MKSVDVLIVGAGPAGAAAACVLQAAGRHVLVLEKESLPRYKACGGAVPAAALAGFPFSFDPVIESRVESVAYAFAGREVAVPLPAGEICMVMRPRFDAWLLEHSGAQVRTGRMVRTVIEEPGQVLVETRSGESFTAPYLIGADGASSVVARSLGLRRGRTLAAAIEAEAPAPPAVLQRFAAAPLFIFDEIPLGYLWVFPKADHLSVGICALHPRPGQLQAVLRRVMDRYGISLDGVVLHGHPLPLDLHRQPVISPRLVLAGDAAGLVDPLNGEGIRFALLSGRLAGEAILAGRLENYPRRLDRFIRRDHRYSLGLAWLFYHFPGLCFRFGVQYPLATYAFLDLLTGRAAYPQVVLRLIAGPPRYALARTLSAAAAHLGCPQLAAPICAWLAPELKYLKAGSPPHSRL